MTAALAATVAAGATFTALSTMWAVAMTRRPDTSCPHTCPCKGKTRSQS